MEGARAVDGVMREQIKKYAHAILHTRGLLSS